MDDRAMSPTGVFVMLVLGFLIDFLSVGPDSLRDRVAFLFYLAGFRDGFDGSPLDQWTVQRLSEGIGWLLDQTGGAYIAGANINIVVGAGVGLLAIYAVACLVPAKLSSKVGRIATLSFPSTAAKRINWKLLGLAALLGMLADLGRGLIGEATDSSVEALTWLVAPLPLALFGAA
jgi:hypothetical protein